MITVIIPILNGEKYVKRCFDSLFSQSFENFKVIVFDDGSTDKTLDIVKQYPVEVIRNRHTVGWARANNACIDRVRTKYALLLNVDTILHKDCLKNLFEFSEGRNDVGCVSPALVEYASFVSGSREDGYPLIFDVQSGLIKAYDTPQTYNEVSFVPGTALFADLEKVRGDLYFREDFFMYHEDVELSLRILSRTSYKLYFLKTAVVAHDSKQSFSRTSTCRRALKNLFSCLVEYQDWKTFLALSPRYLASMIRMYLCFYRHYYPVSFLFYGLFYFLTSFGRMRKSKTSLRRLETLNRSFHLYQKKFEFLF